MEPHKTTTTTNTTSSSFELAPVSGADWLIRMTLAGTYRFHGSDKFPNIAAGAEWMGIPYLLWLLVALGEIAAGAGIIAGRLIPGAKGDLVTRASGAVMAVIMIGGLVTSTALTLVAVPVLYSVLDAGTDRARTFARRLFPRRAASQPDGEVTDSGPTRSKVQG